MKHILKTLGFISLFLLIGAGCMNTPSGGDNGGSGGGDEAFSGSLQAALQLGKAMKCTWSTNEGDGITYVKGDNVRTESTADGKKGYIIGKDNCTYIWEDGASDGIQFCQDESTTLTGGAADGSPASGDESFDPDPGVDVDCRVQKVNDSMFEPPSNVNFSNPLEGLLNF